MITVRCHKCKQPTNNYKFVLIRKENTKYAFCKTCFDRRQEWRQQRGLPLDR